MPTIDATVGGNSSNSYSDVSTADTYFDERVQSSNWTGESDEDVKERALIMATRRVDQLRFEGLKTDDTQSLKWPRVWAFDEDGYEYDTASIPDIVQHATFEWALKILNDNAGGTDPLADGELEQFDRAKVGPLEVDIRRSHKASKTPENVMRILRPVLASAGLMARLERS